VGGRESAEEEEERQSAEEEEERECVGEPEEEEEGGGDAGNAYEAERDARVRRNRDAMIEMGLARKPPPLPPPPPRAASAKRSVTRSTSRWGLALLVNQALSYTSVCGLRLLVYAALRY
jgi:hypothetical protein